MHKNAYITFYGDYSSHIRIGNGFSFARKFINGDDFFFRLNRGFPETLKLKQKLKSYKNIFCSITFDEELRSVEPIINEKWILGGPLCCHADLSHLNCQKQLGCFESFQDSPVSNDFQNYWKNSIPTDKEWHYTCSLGQGCYWNKCEFCEYKYYEKVQYERNDFKKIFSSLKGRRGNFYDHVHLCSSAIGPKIIKDVITSILENKLFQQKIIITMMVRPDPGIIKAIQEFDNLKGITFCLGLEAFCQPVLDIVNKGAKIESGLKFAEEAAKRKAIVCLSLMDHYGFLTHKMADESIEIISQFKKLPVYRRIKQEGVFAFNNGITYWPDERFVSQFAKKTETINQGNRKHWINVIDPGSEAWEANKRISFALENNLRMMGCSFKTLDEQWSLKQREKFLLKLK